MSAGTARKIGPLALTPHYPPHGQPYPQQVPPHGQPPPYHQQPPYAPPGPTVWGVPLEPGERVLYYKRHTGSGERIFMFAMGVLFLPVLFGLLLLYWAVFYEETHERAQVITDRRIMGITGTRKLKTVFAASQVERVVRVTGQKNQYVLHGPGLNLMTFNYSEHHFAALEPVLQSLRNPQVLPSVPSEP